MNKYTAPGAPALLASALLRLLCVLGDPAWTLQAGEGTEESTRHQIWPPKPYRNYCKGLYINDIILNDFDSNTSQSNPQEPSKVLQNTCKSVS